MGFLMMWGVLMGVLEVFVVPCKCKCCIDINVNNIVFGIVVLEVNIELYWASWGLGGSVRWGSAW